MQLFWSGIIALIMIINLAIDFRKQIHSQLVNVFRLFIQLVNIIQNLMLVWVLTPVIYINSLLSCFILTVINHLSLIRIKVIIMNLSYLVQIHLVLYLRFCVLLHLPIIDNLTCIYTSLWWSHSISLKLAATLLTATLSHHLSGTVSLIVHHGTNVT